MLKPMRSYKGKQNQIHPMYAQLLFVWLAFTLMILSSYRFVSDIERKHLIRDAEDALSFTQANIAADMLEPETMLSGISQTVRYMINRGDSVDMVHDYMEELAESVFTDGRHVSGFAGAYGFFDIFGGAILDSENRPFPAGYVTAERSWYQEAVAAHGGMIITQPYADLITGQIIITFARRIFDDTGIPLAVIALDVMIDNLKSRVFNMRHIDGGYGVLLNNRLEILAHPDPALLGKSLQDTDSGLAALAGELTRGQEISERETNNFRGDNCVVFFRQIENGWHLGIVTPIEKYYQSTRDMAVFLTFLGVTLALVLTTILGRIVAERNAMDERTRVMLDTMPLCAAFWDKDLNIVDVNQEAVNLFELPDKQEYINKFYGLSPEFQPDGKPSAETAVQLINKGFREGRCHFEWMHRKLDGELMPAEITLVRVKYKGVYSLVGYTRDLREYKAMVNEMRRITIAEESNKAKSKFLATMSHEIRTPLNAILGITEIQMQNKALPQDTGEALGKIYSSADLLLRIINDILDLSKIEAGKLELVPVKYETASLISDTMQLNMTRIGSKLIRFKLQVDPSTPCKLLGDELRIKQILNNLLTNALKYTESGEIVLSVTADPVIGPEAAEGDAGSNVILVLKVSDTGQGMSKEQVEGVFGEYLRFNLEANRAIQGAGLGLNITRRLVDMMNGTITVESEPGKGSTFTVRLPQGSVGAGALGRELAENLLQFHFENPGMMRKANIIREPMPYGRVLVVDDVETNLYVAKGLLSPYGLRIETAESGPAAIAKIRGGPAYDVVFMDHMMPGMDGIEATRIIREQGYRGVIVALTANAVAGQAEMFLSNGFDGFISKPIDLRQLDASLNKLIRDKQPAEVVEAARTGSYRNEERKKEIQAELVSVFARDAERALAVLEEICERGETLTEDDLRLYCINTHGMKSALANVGEQDLSAAAAALETAGRGRDIAAIQERTPGFLRELRAAVIKMVSRERETQGDSAAEDRGYLQEKMRAFEEACAAYDKKAAKDVLIEVKKRTWPPRITYMLNIVTEHLLHSEFDEAVNIARGL